MAQECTLGSYPKRLIISYYTYHLKLGRAFLYFRRKNVMMPTAPRRLDLTSTLLLQLVGVWVQESGGLPGQVERGRTGCALSSY